MRLALNFEEVLRAAKDYCSITFGPTHSTMRKDYTSVCLDDYKTSDISRLNNLEYRELWPNVSVDEEMLSFIETAYITRGNETFSSCNQTKRWRVEDNNVKSVCEGNSPNNLLLPDIAIKGNIYKNYACFICNPLLGRDAEVRIISTCNYTGFWDTSHIPNTMKTELEQLCENGRHHRRWSPFKNFFCSECNLPSIRILPTPAPPRGGGGGLGMLNPYRILFDLSYAQVMDATKEATPVTCTNGTFDVKYETCKSVVCLEDRVLENGTCRPNRLTKKDTLYIIALALKPPDTASKQVNFTSCFGSEYLRGIDMASNDTTGVLMMFNNTIDELAAHFCGNLVINATMLVHSPCDVDQGSFYMTPHTSMQFTCSVLVQYNPNTLAPPDNIRFDKVIIADTLIQFEQSIFQTLTKPFRMQTAGNCTLVMERLQSVQRMDTLNPVSTCKFSNIYRDINVNSASIAVDRFLQCPQVQFKPREYRYDNTSDSVTIIKNTITIPFGYFKMTGTTVRICADDYLALKSKHSQNQTTKEIHQLWNVLIDFSNVAICISFAFLALTFVIYCAYPSLRNMPGKNTMVLVFCLLTAQILLKFTLRLQRNTLLCQTMGALIHYFWLSTFCAMNVSSFHVMKIFYIQALSQPTGAAQMIQFCKYLAYVFGAPLAVVCATLSYHLISTDGQHSGYGKFVCFLSDVNSSIAAFIVPSALIFISNIAFFSVAFHKIRTSPKMQKSTARSRNDFMISIKLCIIVGLTWPLQIIDAAFGLSIFSFIVEAVNALQGVLLFLILVCSSRVMALMKKTVGLDRSTTATSYLTDDTSTRD